MSESHDAKVLVTVSGPDQPGITSEILKILADSDSELLDMGQSVIHGLLSLSVLFELHEKDRHERTTIKDLLFKATELGMKLEFQLLDSDESKHHQIAPRNFRYVITMINSPISAQAIHEITDVIASHNLNIDFIKKLSADDFSCIELQVSSARRVEEAAIKTSLLKLTTTHNVDLAFQADGPFRRAKRLVVFDMDSTLIQNEVIDEFGRERGVFEKIAAITEQAMKGELNFDSSLESRCAALKGLTSEQIQNTKNRIKITTGAEELIRVLKKLGFKIALISGGFAPIANSLKEELGLDYAYANEMEMRDGIFTGKVHQPYVNAQRKSDLLDVIAQQEKISLDQVIAIGDGANDLPMLKKAGLGIAFNAKPAVQKEADLSLTQKSLKSILYLLGITAQDADGVLRS